MKNQLIQYVELLFAAAPDAEEIKQEILQNTLDRYDDLIAQGKSPEAAYRLAISGIGDINEILCSSVKAASIPSYQESVHGAIQDEVEDIRRRNLKAAAVAMYILCIVPLIILSEFGLDTLGLCFTLLLVAAATALMIMTSRKSSDEPPEVPSDTSPQSELRQSIGNVIWAVGLAIYFIVSFSTQAWYITWVIFPIIGSVRGLVNACIDLKEASKYEN